MRKYASAEERAAKNQKTTVRHFDFTEKVYGFPCTVRTMFSGSGIIGMPSCVFRFLRGAIAVEARRRWAASARIYCVYTSAPYASRYYSCASLMAAPCAEWHIALLPCSTLISGFLRSVAFLPQPVDRLSP